MTNPGLWIDDASAPRWANSCRLEILGWLAALAGSNGAQMQSELQAEVVPPAFDEAKRAFEGNTDMSGCVRYQWGDTAIELVIPMPFHGVFLSHRPDFQRGLVSVWGAWLGEAPGFRLVCPTSQTRRNQIQWRIGLPGGRFVGARLEKPTKEERKRMNLPRYFGSAKAYPDWLRSYLEPVPKAGVLRRNEIV